jgi:hypothetical protein
MLDGNREGFLDETDARPTPASFLFVSAPPLVLLMAMVELFINDRRPGTSCLKFEGGDGRSRSERLNLDIFPAPVRANECAFSISQVI